MRINRIVIALVILGTVLLIAFSPLLLNTHDTSAMKKALTIAAIGLIARLSNFGGDPEEKKRAERMIAQNEEMISQNRMTIRIAIGALLVSLVSLVLSVVSLLHLTR